MAPKIEKEKEVESWRTKHTTVTAWMPAFAWCPCFSMNRSARFLTDPRSVRYTSTPPKKIYGGGPRLKVGTFLDFITDFQKLHRWSVQVAPATLYHGIVRSFIGCRERAILRNENHPYAYLKV